jgi:hypothetical protein
VFSVVYVPVYWQDWHTMRAVQAIRANVPVLPDTIGAVDTDANEIHYLTPIYEN